MLRALLVKSDREGIVEICDNFFERTQQLMQKESWASVGSDTRNVDIVRDVLKYVPIYWACEMVSDDCD